MAVPKRNWQQTYTSSVAPQKEKQITVKIHKQSWITKGEKVLYSLVGTFLIIAGIFIVSYSSSTDTLNRELQNLEKTVQTLHISNEELVFEIKELSRPERIIQFAKDNGLKIQDAEVKQATAFNN